MKIKSRKTEIGHSRNLNTSKTNYMVYLLDLYQCIRIRIQMFIQHNKTIVSTQNTIIEHTDR